MINLDKKLQMFLQDRVDERLKKYNAGGKQSIIKVKLIDSWYILDNNIWNMDLLAVDLILCLISKLIIFYK